MRRFGLMFALLLLLGLIAVAAPTTAQSFNLHPHMLVQKLEIALIDGYPHLVGFRGCVDLAANHPVPLHAHHQHLHFGDSGVSGGGESGHAVVPAAPFPSPHFEPVPWSNCEEFATYLPLPIPGG